MYGAYKRTVSVFQNSNMMAQDKPGEAELALLEPFRGKVPDEVFGEPYLPPVSDGSGQDRALLRKASQLLQQAGYPIKDGKRVDARGEPVTFEFLLDEPSFQPHHMPFIKNLATLGIDATLRLVDPVQYRKRVDEFDYDVTVERFNFSATPGDSLRSFFSTESAGRFGSYNRAVADPVVDALIEKILAAETREALTVACRALDRVIRAGRYWIPHWYLAAHRIAYWDVFGFPPKNPAFTRGIPETWWYDQDKAAKLERGR
jgi:microcin C transport system substrate-binding protein